MQVYDVAEGFASCVGCPAEITLTQRHSLRLPLLHTYTEKERDGQTWAATQTERDNQIQTDIHTY